MRSSSVKTLVSVASITLTLVLAAPSAEARPAQRSRGSQTTQSSVTDRAQRVVRQLLQRFFGISANELPSDPIPGFAELSGDTPELPSDPIPRAPVKP
jgi:hypothetical protein